MSVVTSGDSWVPAQGHMTAGHRLKVLMLLLCRRKDRLRRLAPLQRCSPLDYRCECVGRK